MGKYMRSKSKTTGEVSLMDVPSSLGVRTRAKTLALQKAAAATAGAGAGAGSYIQLRSRRLVKPTPPRQKEKEKERVAPPNPTNKSSSRGGADSSRLKVNCEDSESVKCSPTEKLVGKEENIHQDGKVKDAFDLGIDEEASFGENMLENEGRERSTREMTPCSLIRDSDIIRTPGSTTKPTSSTDGNCRVPNSTPSHIPSTIEMDEFFTGPERQQQKLFIEKYNFDPVSDKPLLGRYEWSKVDDTGKR